MSPRNVFKALIFVGVSSLNTWAQAQNRPALGGDSAGGGNLLKPASVDFRYLQSLIEGSRLSAALTFQDLEYGITWNAQPRPMEERDPALMAENRELARILFNGPSNVYALLRSAKFNVLPAGPCRDPKTGEARDASAQNGAICFSLERLAAKANPLVLEREITALVVHEISHLAGVESEETAVDLQREAVIKARLAGDFWRNGKVARDFLKDLNGDVGVMEQLLPLVDSDDKFRDARICATMKVLDETGALGAALARMYSADRVVLLSRPALERLVVASLKISAAHSTYCGTGAATRLDYGRTGQISLATYAKTNSHPIQDLQFDFPQATMRYVAPKDVKTLRVEIREAAAALKDARRSAEQINF